jgi:hypothetical protein
MDKPRSVSAKFVLPPNTAITKTKVNKKKHKATFKFSSTGGGGTIGFECKLDHRHFKPCSSPKTYKHLKAGKHTFRVRSRNEAGADASPAKKKFRIPKRHK